MLAFLRIIKFAFQDIWRNIGLSFMTVLILILMLFSVNMLWSVKVLTNEAVSLVKDQVSLATYLVPSVSDKEVMDLKNQIESISEVEKVDTMSRAQVLESFQKRHQMSPEVLDALKELGTNPFGPTLMIKTKEPDSYKEVLSVLNSPNYASIIESKSFEGHEDALVRLQSITNRVENMGLGLTLAFGLIAFLIIFNTVRVAIFTHRTEISIKRLVGAHNWFIRGPYLVESLLFTVISVVITAVILYFVFQKLDPYLGAVFPQDFSLTNYYRSNILYLALVQTTSVLVLTTLSSSLAMRKQLKV
jgi:cell division transport system permease protein